MKMVDRLVVKSVVVMLVVVVGSAGCVPNGRSRAVRPYGVPAPLQLQTAVAVDKEGNQVLVGSFAGHLEVAGTELVSAGGTDIFVTKTDKAGAALFAPLRFGGSGNDSATGVALDEGGVIIVAGTFQEQATFGTSSLRAEVRLGNSSPFSWPGSATKVRSNGSSRSGLSVSPRRSAWPSPPITPSTWEPAAAARSKFRMAKPRWVSESIV